MAYRPRLMFAAEGAVTDLETKTLSVFNILEELTPLGYPSLIPKICVVSVIARDTEDPPQPEASVRFDLDGERLFETPGRIDFADKLQSRLTLILNGLVIPRPGILMISALVAGNVLQTYDIRVRPAVAPAVQPAAAPPGHPG